MRDLGPNVTAAVYLPCPFSGSAFTSHPASVDTPEVEVHFHAPRLQLKVSCLPYQLAWLIHAVLKQPK